MEKYIIGISVGLTLLFAIIGLFLILKLVAYTKKSKIKRIGEQFEKKVSKLLEAWVADKHKFFHLPSLYKSDKDAIFEVDGVIVTSRAILVLELKSVTGSIKGDASEPLWSKNINGKVYDFKNPIMQNDKHIDHLMKIIKIKIPMLSVIVFDSKVKAIEVLNQPEHVIVTTDKKLLAILDELDGFLKVKLNNDEIEHINNLLINHKTKSRKDKQNHAIYTRQRKI